MALSLKSNFQQIASDNMRAGGKYKGSTNLTTADRIDVRQEIANIAGTGTGNVSKVEVIIERAHPNIVLALQNCLLSIHQAWKWVARILISWGIVAVLTGFVQTVHQLYLARFLMGLAEAGYVPGILLYLTFWFRQRELAQAIALFMTAVPVTSFVGAPLSGLILDHVHWLGFSSWRWLLMLEGVPAVVCGLLTYFLLPNGPSLRSYVS